MDEIDFWQIQIDELKKVFICSPKTTANCTFLQKRLCFPVNFAKFLRSPFLENTFFTEHLWVTAPLPAGQIPGLTSVVVVLVLLLMILNRQLLLGTTDLFHLLFKECIKISSSNVVILCKNLMLLNYGTLRCNFLIFWNNLSAEGKISLDVQTFH